MCLSDWLKPNLPLAHMWAKSSSRSVTCLSQYFVSVCSRPENCYPLIQLRGQWWWPAAPVKLSTISPHLGTCMFWGVFTIKEQLHHRYMARPGRTVQRNETFARAGLGPGVAVQQQGAHPGISSLGSHVQWSDVILRHKCVDHPSGIKFEHNGIKYPRFSELKYLFRVFKIKDEIKRFRLLSKTFHINKFSQI